MQRITFSYRGQHATVGSDSALILRDQLYALSNEVREAMALGLRIENALAKTSLPQVRIALDYEWAGYIRHAIAGITEQIPALRTSAELVALTTLVTIGLS